VSRWAVRLAALVALALGLTAALAGGAVWGSFGSRAAANTGDSITAAPDFVPPRAAATAIAMSAAAGTISPGGVYYVYAEVVDSGNPASGVAAVSADLGAITPGQTAVTLNQGSYSAGGVSYNRRSAALTASRYLPEGAVTYALTMTDAAGNSAREEGFEVLVDNTPITAADVQTENHGRRDGRAEEGDTITYRFSEPPDPGSILAGWDGSAAAVVVRLENGHPDDTVTIYDHADASQLPLGTLRLGRGDYTNRDRTFGAGGTASTMVLSGDEVTITLGRRSGNARRARGNGTMEWRPSSGLTDLAGTPMSTAPAHESGGADREF
jgi:hypothetical protein